MGFFSRSKKSSLRPDSVLSRGSSRGSRTGSPGNDGSRSLSNPQPFPAAIPAYPQEAPPAYTPQMQAPMADPGAGADSPYAFLNQFDTVFLIDDSGSMAGRSWRETEAALAAIAPICTERDVDGIDIYFLNHINRNTASDTGAYHGVTSPMEVHEIFTMVSPRGGTPTGKRLGHILKPYLDQLVARVASDRTANSDTLLKPLNIIVITDGVPTDDVESVIVSAARTLDRLNAQPWQVGIQFFQVGNEPEAAEDLRDLDDALSGQQGVRDMVDTVPWNAQNAGTLTADGILKVVLGAVHRKYDRRNATGRRSQN